MARKKRLEGVAMVNIEEIPALEDIRNRLITECHAEPVDQRAGYINGILDMYNEAKKRQEKLLGLGKEIKGDEYISPVKQKGGS